MYSIGEISKIVKISIDSLRYYDEIGLLKPYYIDEVSRYRYYSEEQVSDILFIMELKQYGFSLDAIKQLMVCDNINKMKDALNTRMLDLSRERATIEKSMNLLKRRLLEIENRGNYNMDNKKILIVDDAEFMRYMLKDYFTNHGFKILGEATNGLEAVEKYFEINPDIVIMNVEMPELDGIEAVKRIKKKDPNAKVVMCSAKGYIPTILESIKAGASNFVVKPFNPECLKEALLETLEKNISYNENTINKIENIMKDNYLNGNECEEVTSKRLFSQTAISKLLSMCKKENLEKGDKIDNFLI